MRLSFRAALTAISITVMISTVSGVSGVSSVDSSTVMFDSTDLNSWPVRSLTELIGLHGGVAVITTRPGEAFSLTTDHLSVRGGGPDNLRSYINGLGITDPYTGYRSFAVSSNSISRFQFNALDVSGQYPSGGLGVADLTTRRGGDQLSGFVEAISDNRIGTDFDQNWYTLGLSGPLAQLTNVRFSTVGERRYFGERRPSIRTDDFLPGSPKSLPSNGLEGWNYSGRLDWQVTPKLDLGLTADGSTESWLEYSQPYYFDSRHVPCYEDRNELLAFTLNHGISDSFRYRARLSHLSSERFRGDATLRDNLSSYERPYANQLTGWHDWFWYSEEMDDSQYPTPAHYFEHYYDDYYRHHAERLQFDGLAEWQFKDYHRVTMGVEYRRYAFRLFHNLWPTSVLGYSPNWVTRYGYSAEATEIDSDSTSFHDVKRPTELALFVSDRIEKGSTTLTGSLRLDMFDYNEMKFKDPGRPIDPNHEGDGLLDVDDLEPTEVRWCLSPAVELEVVLNDWSCLTTRLGISHQAQPYSVILTDYDYVHAVPSHLYTTWADIDPVKTLALDVGVQIYPSEMIDLTVGLFSQKSENELLIYTEPAVPFSYSHFDNGNSTRSLGAELSADIRPSNSFRLRLNYTFTSSEDIGSMATYANAAWVNPGAVPTEFMIADHEQRHALKIAADLRVGDNRGPVLGGCHIFENFGLGLLVNYASGKPYTETRAYDQLKQTHTSWTEALGETNAERQRAVATIDFNLHRPMELGGMALTPFLTIKNLLNRENIVSVYSGTGRADQTGYLQTPEGLSRIEGDNLPPDGTGLGLEDKYHLAERDPLNYGRPRQILFGLRFSF
jgi:hypothetical protein